MRDYLYPTVGDGGKGGKGEERAQRERERGVGLREIFMIIYRSSRGFIYLLR